ncbi:SDR family NAD(P)-dependent oxidoreductase [Vannielia litorea]|nr:SDR family NAD(P)-dependent oxidoreductase [Vannielia litorea]MBY6076440.1 SDR family NAD(P)-dependent oxidoreductase [Vannielia litorea]
MSFDDRAFRQKVIVMTGGTSGFGAKALELLAQERDTRIILGARGEGRAVPAGVEVLPLDLASLQSTRAFAAEVQRRLAGDGIDVLLLNAGLHGSKAGQVSAEGYGLTFAVNHLAHYPFPPAPAPPRPLRAAGDHLQQHAQPALQTPRAQGAGPFRMGASHARRRRHRNARLLCLQALQPDDGANPRPSAGRGAAPDRRDRLQPRADRRGGRRRCLAPAPLGDQGPDPHPLSGDRPFRAGIQHEHPRALRPDAGRCGHRQALSARGRLCFAGERLADLPRTVHSGAEPEGPEPVVERECRNGRPG